MRSLLGLLCCLPLAAGDVGQLRRLYQENRIFQLREALQQPGWSDSEIFFYRAVTEARLGQEKAAIDDVRKFLATHPNPEMARKSHEEIASALARIGQYGEAARAWAEALRLTPPKDADRAANQNTRALYESLSYIALQTVQFGRAVTVTASHNALGSWDVPVEVNGRAGEWIFDTGASLSTLSESEAARMGLSTHETSAYVEGSTQKKNTMRVAVAPELHFGAASLSNVVFLVLPDAALHVVTYQIRGILGLPVLRALGSVGISAEGVTRIGTNEAGTLAEPNMFFDELAPVVETRHADRRLQMLLDTGANTSVVYPSFRPALSAAEIAGLRSKQEKRGGAGGIITQKTEVIPTLHLEILGRSVDLPNISLLRKQPSGNQRYRDGVLGMDGLSGGFTLDFHKMQLRLE